MTLNIIHASKSAATAINALMIHARMSFPSHGNEDHALLAPSRPNLAEISRV